MGLLFQTNCHSVQFNSCDGTAWYTRVRNTYTCNGYSSLPLPKAMTILKNALMVADWSERACSIPTATILSYVL